MYSEASKKKWKFQNFQNWINFEKARSKNVGLQKLSYLSAVQRKKKCAENRSFKKLSK